MDERQKKELLRMAGSNLAFDCPMETYTTFRVGGRAEGFYRAEDRKRLQQVVSYLTKEDIPYTVIGKGSNVLVSDRGVKGVVIRLQGGLALIDKNGGGTGAIGVGGGMPLSELVGECSRMGLGGCEFLAGIPGTAGGAVAMNAGAWGQEMESIVLVIDVINRKGEMLSTQRSRLRFSYRNLLLPEGAIIIRAGLGLKRESSEDVADRVARYLKKRRATQPLNFPSGGSIFKNPSKGFAGELIERAGLKGERIGGAMISDQHANFFINTGGAKASDIMALMDLARKKVKDLTGIELEPEIKVVGL